VGRLAYTYWILGGAFEQFGAGFFVVNFLGAVPLTIFTTWFFNHARSSILLAVVFHVTFNLVNAAWLPVGVNPVAFLVFVVMEWVLALLLSTRLNVPGTKAA
jgi:hypothetical protein